MLRRLICALSVLVALPAHAVSASVDKEIKQLLNFVGHSPCTFIRAGTPYTSSAAQEHLTMKYGKAQSKINSSEDFINEVASKSYLSGQPYMVQCPKIAEQSAKAWLDAELKRLRAEKK